MGSVFKHSGDFKQIEAWFLRAKKLQVKTILEKYGQLGVQALAKATPLDTGLTADSWHYKVSLSNDGYVINWTNDNVVDGVPIAIILQYGHGTRNGGYVPGRDYINPTLKPILDDLSNKLWEEVRRL